MKAIFHQLTYKILSLVVSFLMLFGISVDFLKADDSAWNTNYSYVFVHGLSGWGSYDAVYRLMPYWGMFGGDLLAYLNDKGFACYAASVAKTASAWDRACELYAQLTGTVVDYGEAHSTRCGHDRFGADFTGRALLTSWDEENKINLLGHSFGGATVRLFASLLAQGDEAERAVTPEGEISPFFTGGKGGYIYSITALAAPHNGTTAYNTGEDGGAVGDAMDSLVSELTGETPQEAREAGAASDNAAYDMYIDNALALNERIATLENVYYFSFACDASIRREDGTYVPDPTKMESLFLSGSAAIGAYTGVTKNGYVLDESWRQNDGLVNTLSAIAPFNAPSKPYEAGEVQPGIWNVMPIYDGDHMSLQGGLFQINDVKDLYTEFLGMINSL